MHPMLMNFNSDGRSWIENGITADMVTAKNRHISHGSYILWEYSREFIIKPAIKSGMLGLSG
jgi:putative hydrolases of HD superfamily